MIYYLGITGPHKSGKTTLANQLAEVFRSSGVVPIHLNFADEVRLELVEAGWDREMVFGANKPNYLRSLLIGWGEGKRSQNPHYWVSKWLQRVGQQAIDPSLNHIVISSDTYHFNEANLMDFLVAITWSEDVDPLPPPTAALNVREAWLLRHPEKLNANTTHKIPETYLSSEPFESGIAELAWSKSVVSKLASNLLDSLRMRV